MRVQIKFVTLLTALVVAAGCSPMTEATETEQALCEAWRDSLPSRSFSDTEKTQSEIGVAYDIQAAACPRFARF